MDYPNGADGTGDGERAPQGRTQRFRRRDRDLELRQRAARLPHDFLDAGVAQQVVQRSGDGIDIEPRELEIGLEVAGKTAQRRGAGAVLAPNRGIAAVVERDNALRRVVQECQDLAFDKGGAETEILFDQVDDEPYAFAQPRIAQRGESISQEREELRDQGD